MNSFFSYVLLWAALWSAIAVALAIVYTVYHDVNLAKWIKQKRKNKMSNPHINNLINTIINLEARGVCILGLGYFPNGSNVIEVKNFRIGGLATREPPYGVAITSALSEHKGNYYLRGIDHNEGRSPKMLRIDRVAWIKVDKKFERCI